MTAVEGRVRAAHLEQFGVEGSIYSAPARVNLIGEHTDYTGGLVMPMAIEFRTVAAISPRDDGQAVFYSANYQETRSFDIASLDRSPEGHWSDYAAGVIWSLKQEGVVAPGFNMSIDGDVPLGAGLSSSASIEVAVATAVMKLADVSLPLEKVATLCRRAENEYVGAPCGIMDQFIVAGGVEHRAMMLDTRSLAYELLPLPEEIRVVIANSMVRHSVATGGYGNRRDEVEEGQAVIRREFGRELLRDASLEELEACKEKMSPESYLRCRHIISENARVLAAREALLAGDLTKFGELMVAAHASMRDDFQASCPEIDTLVEIAMRQPGCIGARITGGGFGGCTVNVVKTEAVDDFVAQVKAEYERATGIKADCFVSSPSDGALALVAKGDAA
ncbi:MAG TPA: galactokinase [Edaphobacter sp.]